MLRYYYINKEWMLSRAARRIYRMAAILSFLLFLFLLSRPFLPQLPYSMLPIVRLLILCGVLGAATTIVAMEYFLFGFDTSPAWKKVFWFFVMLAPPIGPPIYCFAVYLRSTVVTTYIAKADREFRTP